MFSGVSAARLSSGLDMTDSVEVQWAATSLDKVKQRLGEVTVDLVETNEHSCISANAGCSISL